MNIQPVTIRISRETSGSGCPFRKFEVIKRRGYFAKLIGTPKYNLVIDVKSKNGAHTMTTVKVSSFKPIRWIQIKYYKHKYR